jgi:two-component system, NarL family, response regulator DevR
MAFGRGVRRSSKPGDLGGAVTLGPAIRILIADDHEVVRVGLAALLDRQADLSVVGAAASGDEAIELARTLHPDVVLLDVRMANGSGNDACRAITAESPQTPVVMLSGYRDDESLFGAIDAGASGYLMKRVRGEELADALRTVVAGRSTLDPAVTAAVLERLRAAARSEQSGAFRDLTEQERRVLAQVAVGKSNREIAGALELAEKTVRNYVSNILAKLALSSRAQAATFAFRNRLSELDRLAHG